MADILLEVCVDNAVGLQAAIDGGADRIELCSSLQLGGLTPSVGLMQWAAKAPVPVYAMIRPRAGDFVFSKAEFEIMCTDIDQAREAGLAGVVLGACEENGALDQSMLTALVEHASGMGMTLHRAFDCAGPDFRRALDVAIALGFERVLTSGGAVRAIEGLDVLRTLFEHAKGAISIMPGAGIKVSTIGPLLANLPLREVHGSCSQAILPAPGPAHDLGFADDGQRQTSAEMVRGLKVALAG